MTRALALSLLAAMSLFAQDAPVPVPVPDQTTPQGLPQTTPLLSPDQLDTLVAPIALYPDPLLSQVMAASTYPLEIIEAQQFVQQHPNLRGPQLLDEAKRQNWDPSVQALVAFPDVLTLLTRDVRWTTDLGNAFLAQQTDVMAAVQRMRARAQSNGKLRSTPQQTVTTEFDDGQSAIEIQPADPQVIYVPTYNPVYVWGPPVYGFYPPLFYPTYGFGSGPGVFLGGLFGGFLTFGGWGWGFGWFSHGLFLNGLFFSHFGYGGYGRGYGGFGGRTWWAHDPGHRLGVAYPRSVGGRFNGGSRSAGSNWRSFNNARSFSGGSFRNSPNNAPNNSPSGARAFNGSRASAAQPSQGSRSFSGNQTSRANASNSARSFSNAGQSNRGFSANSSSRSNFSAASRAPQATARNFGGSSGFGRSFSGSPQHFSAPRAPSQHFSAPRSSGHFSAPSGSSHSGGGGHSGGSHRR